MFARFLFDEKTNCFACLPFFLSFQGPFSRHPTLLCPYIAWRDLTKKTDIHRYTLVIMHVHMKFFAKLFFKVISFRSFFHLNTHVYMYTYTWGHRKKDEIWASTLPLLLLLLEWGMECNNLSVRRNDKDDDKHYHTYILTDTNYFIFISCSPKLTMQIF